MNRGWMMLIWGSAMMLVLAGGAGIFHSFTSAAAIAAGGVPPLLISSGSLIFYYARCPADERAQYRFMIANFALKMVLIGLWTAVILLSSQLPRTLFSVSLLCHFLVWHFVEAYSYQQEFQRQSQDSSRWKRSK